MTKTELVAQIVNELTTSNDVYEYTDDALELDGDCEDDGSSLEEVLADPAVNAACLELVKTILNQAKGRMEMTASNSEPVEDALARLRAKRGE